MLAHTSVQRLEKLEARKLAADSLMEELEDLGSLAYSWRPSCPCAQTPEHQRKVPMDTDTHEITLKLMISPAFQLATFGEIGRFILI